MTLAAIPPRRLSANGIDIAFHDVGEGPAILLLHGFPGLAYDWRWQVPALVDAGWRVIVPDLRGSGATGPQGKVADYSLRNICLDVVGLMDALGIARAPVIGHDFGGVLVWALGRDHPNRVLGVASLNTPYTRRAEFDLAETMRRYRGETNYIVVFQTPGVGEAVLESDVEETFRGTFRRPGLTLDEFKADARLSAMPVTIFGREPALKGAPIDNEVDLAVYVAAFERTGFGGGTNWYRNFHRNWLDTADTPDRVLVPSLMVVPDNDYFLPPETTRGMQRHIEDLEFAFIENCGHWTQREQPTSLNAILVEWLERRMRPVMAEMKKWGIAASVI